jgi:hypothetical protein
MYSRTLLIVIAVSAITSTAIAQPASSPSEPGKISGLSTSGSSESKASYGPDDCRKDMENARDAKQAGHITEREYAEQKKMAQAKLKRDSGQGGAADKNIECK